jgi:hypothetical protein
MSLSTSTGSLGNLLRAFSIEKGYRPVVSNPERTLAL